MKPPRTTFAAAIAVTAALALAGCGGDDDEGGSSGSGSSDSMSSEQASGGSGASAGSGPVTIKDFLYEPADVTVSAGESISFTNEDSAKHTATADDGSFDTGDLGKGDSGEVSVDEPGTYPYICSFHPFMKGTVTVEG